VKTCSARLQPRQTGQMVGSNQATLMRRALGNQDKGLSLRGASATKQSRWRGWEDDTTRKPSPQPHRDCRGTPCLAKTQREMLSMTKGEVALHRVVMGGKQEIWCVA